MLHIWDMTITPVNQTNKDTRVFLFIRAYSGFRKCFVKIDVADNNHNILLIKIKMKEIMRINFLST